MAKAYTAINYIKLIVKEDIAWEWLNLGHLRKVR